MNENQVLQLQNQVQNLISDKIRPQTTRNYLIQKEMSNQSSQQILNILDQIQKIKKIFKNNKQNKYVNTILIFQQKKNFKIIYHLRLKIVNQAGKKAIFYYKIIIIQRFQSKEPDQGEWRHIYEHITRKQQKDKQKQDQIHIQIQNNIKQSLDSQLQEKYNIKNNLKNQEQKYIQNWQMDLKRYDNQKQDQDLQKKLQNQQYKLTLKQFQLENNLKKQIEKKAEQIIDKKIIENIKKEQLQDIYNIKQSQQQKRIQGQQMMIDVLHNQKIKREMDIEEDKKYKQQFDTYNKINQIIQDKKDEQIYLKKQMIKNYLFSQSNQASIERKTQKENDMKKFNQINQEKEQKHILKDQENLKKINKFKINLNNTLNQQVQLKLDKQILEKKIDEQQGNDYQQDLNLQKKQDKEQQQITKQILINNQQIVQKQIQNKISQQQASMNKQELIWNKKFIQKCIQSDPILASQMVRIVGKF